MQIYVYVYIYHVITSMCYTHARRIGQGSMARSRHQLLKGLAGSGSLQFHGILLFCNLDWEKTPLKYGKLFWEVKNWAKVMVSMVDMMITRRILGDLATTRWFQSFIYVANGMANTFQKQKCGRFFVLGSRK